MVEELQATQKATKELRAMSQPMMINKDEMKERKPTTDAMGGFAIEPVHSIAKEERSQRKKLIFNNWRRILAKL